MEDLSTFFATTATEFNALNHTTSREEKAKIAGALNKKVQEVTKKIQEFQGNISEQKIVHDINQIIDSSKEMEKSARDLVATIFGSENNLQQFVTNLSDFLKRGVRVEKTNEMQDDRR